ncbi:hypothetical protein CPB86DRAFT_844061 [Serendipita vermifera]|nr:hypothetical protein CPB86DRAFT_844061 [Serendipita vermifera]
MQMPSVAEEVSRQKTTRAGDDEPSIMPTFLFRQIQSARNSNPEKTAYQTSAGVIRPPKIFEIEHDIVYWVQNVDDRASSSPYCAPLITVVEYHDTGKAEQDSTKRFTFKIGRWTPSKEKYQDAISATLIRAPSLSATPHWTLVLVINSQAPCTYKSLPQSLWEHLLEGARGETMIYKMSAFGLSHTSPKHPKLTQSWFYHVYICFSDPKPSSSPSDQLVTRSPPRIRLYIPSPQRGLRFKMEYPQAGIENGISWMTTTTLGDTGSILFLQKSGSNTDLPSIIDSTADVDKANKGGHGGENVSDGGSKPEIVAWPFVYTDGVGLDLIDLHAGVACGPYSWRRYRKPKELDVFKLDELK